MSAIENSSDPRIQALSVHAHPTESIDFASSAFFGDIRIIAGKGDLVEQLMPIVKKSAKDNLWSSQSQKVVEMQTNGADVVRRPQRWGI